MSSVYKFKMATRQNLVRMKSCCFSIGWCFPIALQYGRDKTHAQERWERRGEVGSPLQGGQEGSSWERMEGPLSSSPPIPAKRPSPAREEEEKQMEDAEKWVGEARRLEDVGRSGHHCQPDSWPRWLQRLGHLCQVRRSQPGGSSDELWEANPPGRNSSGLER